MKVRIELEAGETQEQAEDLLEKAIKSKIESRKKYQASERYPDQVVEDFHESIVNEHHSLVDDLVKSIKAEIERDIRGY